MTEAAGGFDVVYALADYTLAAGADIELLAASGADDNAAIDLTGNEIAQIVRGNSGVNVLNGGGGSDTLLGFAGADTLTGGAGNDFRRGQRQRHAGRRHRR